MDKTADSALLAALMGASVDAMIIADDTGRIVRANSAAETLFRHPAGALVGENVSILMPKDVAVHHDDYMERHLRTGEMRIIGVGRDVTGLRGDGTTFPLHLTVGRATTEGGVVFVGILHDQTPRRIAEEALTRSQRMDAIGQMTGGVAHDFNNLLTIIVGNLELLEMAGPEPRNAELIADALAAAEMGADLTSRLLLFSRKGELRPVRLDLDDALDEALRLLRRTLSARCRVEHRKGEPAWPVEIDPVQFQTAIINLALNAQDAMPNGGRLRLEVENIEIDDDYVAQDFDSEPGRYVRVSVSDTGCGMTAEQRARALEPFFTTKPPGKGTGLGLSMVYGYVRQSGGHLTLYSERGKGTTVSLYFPVGRGGAIRPEAPAARPDAFGDGRIVLVVEDDPAVRRLSEGRVAALGFDVVGAGDAQEAWRLLAARDDIAIVFSDLIMPGEMTGEDLAQRIAEERPEISVLLTSGFSGGMANLENVDGHPRLLRKPYRQADLAAALREVVDKLP